MSAKKEMNKIINRHRRHGYRGSPSTLSATTVAGVTYHAMAQDQLHEERYGKVRDEGAYARTPVGRVERILDVLADLSPEEIVHTLRPHSEHSWRDALSSWLEDVHGVCVLGGDDETVSFKYATDYTGTPCSGGMYTDTGGVRIPHKIHNACAANW